MNKVELISVIVAAYNIEDYLEKCIESLLKQSYTELEIIIVDDGSTDATGRICDSYAEKYDNIKVIHKKNGGLSDARNAGLAIAEGGYIGYVDGDDFVEPDMYRAMWQACQESGAEIAICAYRQIGRGAMEMHPTNKQVVLFGEEALDIYICGHEQYHIYNSVWSKLFARRVIEKISFPVGRKSEDIIYTTKAMVKAQKCVFLDTPYYNYVIDREGSIMNSGLMERRFQDEIPFSREQIAYFEEVGMGKLAEKAAYHFYRKMLFYYIDFQDRRMKEAADKLIRMLQSEKRQIIEIYQKEYVAMGDRVRMKMALRTPKLYYYTVKVYDKVIIPLRQRK